MYVGNYSHERVTLSITNKATPMAETDEQALKEPVLSDPERFFVYDDHGILLNVFSSLDEVYEFAREMREAIDWNNP